MLLRLTNLSAAHRAPLLARLRQCPIAINPNYIPYTHVILVAALAVTDHDEEAREALQAPQIAGWGNAMRWLLTGDEFDAAEAYRIGLVQEVVPAGQQVDRAIELASRIAAQAPLGVRATLASSRASLDDPSGALSRLAADLQPLLTSADAAEGVQSFIERRKAVFAGK
jgi:1,4-dihydroxy-2-naphthoyl-CoA synthase